MNRVNRFLVVGAAGLMLQLVLVGWLTTAMALPYPLAVIAAVEAAILHNFWWHERWTWRDRPGWGVGDSCASRLWRFHAANGLASIAGNVLLTVTFVELFAWPTVAANVAAVTSTIASGRWSR
jgi:putative flippase GtrA